MTRNREEGRKYNAAENERPTHRTAPGNPKANGGKTTTNGLPDLREAMETDINQTRKGIKMGRRNGDP